MELRDVALTEFVVFQALWSVEKSRQLLEHIKASHVIVHHDDPQDVYFLLDTAKVIALLAPASNVSSLYEALHLDKHPATPVLESDTDAVDAPDQCVVLEEGRLVGFFDASTAPMSSRLAGQTDGAEIDSETVFRSIVAGLPKKVRHQERFSLLVSLSAATKLKKRTTLPIVLSMGAAVDILVQPRRGLAIEGPTEGTLLVSSEEETLPLQFKLRGVTIGMAELRVFAFHQGQPLGAFTLKVAVAESQEYPDQQLFSHERVLDPISFFSPDLSLLILEHTDSGYPAFMFRVSAQDPSLELNFKPFGPIRLKADALQYFQDFFKDIEALPLTSGREKTIAAERLAAKGTQLFSSLLPPELQVLLWSLRTRIQSVQIQSEEPWIPWELCKLYGRENGDLVEGPFLCEAFAVTRWLPGIPRKPRLQLTNMAVVVPADSGLRYASDERAYLLSLSNEQRRVTPIPATFLDVRAALASGRYDGWHFSGHGSLRGSDPNRSLIALEQHEPLTPEDLSGVVSNLGKAKPMVFLNACQIGRSAMSLTDIGGWARQFLHAGAGAFLGAYWSVYDKPAYDFAREIYARLLNNRPIGRAVQEARTAIKPAGDPTWLAYTVFADPLATVRVDTSAPQ